MLRPLATTLAFLALPIAANAQWQFNGVPVSTALYYQADPLIVSDGAGGAIIVWPDGRNGAYDIYAQRLNAAGVPQWTADGVPLCTQPGSQYTLSMVSDDVGGAVVVWYDQRNSVGTGQDIFAQRVNGSGTALWTADGVSVCSEANDQRDPYIIRSGTNFVVAWWDYRAGSQSDIYAQALNSSGAVQWMADGVQLCSAAGLQLNPRLATDGVGGAIVVWEDLRGGGTGRDIYARLVDRFGVVQWTADGVLVCNAAADQYEPQIVGDGAAGAFIAWYDWRSGPADIYMQRLNSVGAAQWTANGQAICTSAGIADSPSLAQDFSGGAVLVWADRRVSPSTVDIYGQRVNSVGTALWASNGEPICTASNLQLTPRVIRDPAGAHLVTWFDYRSGNPDIYVQRLDYDTGGPLWTPGGVVLCTEPHLQELPSICPDGVGGAIVAWRDLREGNYFDVYAEHVNGTPTPVERTPSMTALRVLPNHPNPFSDATSIEFVLPSASDVEVEVYDVAGRVVATQRLRNAEAGSHVMTFDSSSEGSALRSGVYFYRVRASGETVTKKMVITR